MSHASTTLNPSRLLALAYLIAALLVMQALRVHSHQDHTYHDDHTPEHTHPAQVHLTYFDGTAEDAALAVDLTSEGIVDDDFLPPLMLALLVAALTWPRRRPPPAHPRHAPQALRCHPASPPPARGPPRILSAQSLH